ncbi:YciI family protein [Leifsonia sp. 2MCAF36]|uniref:YciI family protein n=1 Tax=Leifsonia sp. 2MCAF36 TaxID=3232988 RepID=UPI003F9D1639
MRFVLMALGEEGEGGGAPATAPRAELERYDAELVRAGVLLAAEALRPAEEGACVRFEGEQRILSRPAVGALSRFWMLETAGEEEAVEWARRLPLTSGTVEVRRVTGDEGR